MRPAEEGVVHDDDVALVEAVLADPLDDGLDGVRQRADVGGEVVLALGDEASVGVADRGAEVAALADDERVGDLLEHQPHLVDDAHEGVAQHLEGDRVDLCRFVPAVASSRPASWSVMTMLPDGVDRGARAGWQDDGRVELLDDARPDEPASGAEAVRSRTRASTHPCPSKWTCALALRQLLAVRARSATASRSGFARCTARRHAQRRGLDGLLGMASSGTGAGARRGRLAIARGEARSSVISSSGTVTECSWPM